MFFDNLLKGGKQKLSGYSRRKNVLEDQSQAAVDAETCQGKEKTHTFLS